MNNSRRKIEKDVWDKIFTLFFEIIGKHNDRKKFETILTGILSPAEKTMIAKRIAIMYMLLKGINTGSICYTLKVTRTTVAKCSIFLTSNELMTGELKKIIKTDTLKNLFIELLSDLYGPGTPGVNWSAAWRRKQSIEQKKKRGI